MTLDEYLNSMVVEFRNNGREFNQSDRYNTLKGYKKPFTDRPHELIIALNDLRYDENDEPYFGIPNGMFPDPERCNRFIGEYWDSGHGFFMWGCQNYDELQEYVKTKSYKLSSWVRHNLPAVPSTDFHRNTSHLYRFRQVDTLPEGTHYLYPIPVWGSILYRMPITMEMGIHLPDRVIRDARSGLAKILLHEVFEGHGQNLSGVYNLIAATTAYNKIPQESIGFMDANYYTPHLQSTYGTKGIYYPYWEYHIGTTTTVDPNNTPERRLQFTRIEQHIEALQAGTVRADKAFICLNRRTRPHRTYTTLKIHNDWDSARFTWSYTDTYIGVLRSQCRMPETRLLDLGIMGDDYANKMPKLIDYSGEINDTFLHADLQYSAYINLVTETMFEEPDTAFLTEKIFKPIMACQPYIVEGPMGTLEHMRDYFGYQSFAPYIDETYDTIANPAERLQAIFREVERILSFTPEQMAEFMRNVAPICIYNYNKMRERTADEVELVKLTNEVYGWVHGI